MSKYYLGNTGEELPEQLNKDTDATSESMFASDADCVPDTDNSYDLGSASYRFAQAHAASGSFTVGVNIGPAGTKQLHIDGQDAIPQTDNSFKLGSSTRRLAQVNSASGAFTVGVKIGPAGAKQLHVDGQDAVPQADNSFNLGKSARRFANVYTAKITTASGVVTGMSIGAAGANQLHLDGKDIVPQTDNAFNIGKSTKRIATVNSANTVGSSGRFIAGLQIGAGTSQAFFTGADIRPQVDASLVFGTAAKRLANVYTAQVTTTSGSLVNATAGLVIGAGTKQLHLDGQDAVPQTDNSFNLGKTTRRLANVYTGKITTASGVITGLSIGAAGASQLQVDGSDMVPQTDSSYRLGKNTRRIARIDAVRGVFGTGVAAPSGTIEGHGDCTFQVMRSPSEAITSASGISIDLSRSCMFRLDLNHDATIQAFTNAKDGTEYTFLIKNVKPSGTVVWPSEVTWAGGSAPTITKTLNKFDLVTLKYFAGPDKFFGTISQNYS